MDAPDAAEAVVRAARELRPDLTVVARARDARHAQRLYALGATDVVPETVEASLQLAEAVLVDIGTPMGLVIASIHERRDEYRAELGTASGRPRWPRAAGASDTLPPLADVGRRPGRMGSTSVLIRHVHPDLERSGPWRTTDDRRRRSADAGQRRYRPPGPRTSDGDGLSAVGFPCRTRSPFPGCVAATLFRQKTQEATDGYRSSIPADRHLLVHSGSRSRLMPTFR